MYYIIVDKGAAKINACSRGATSGASSPALVRHYRAKKKNKFRNAKNGTAGVGSFNHTSPLPASLEPLHRTADGCVVHTKVLRDRFHGVIAR